MEPFQPTFEEEISNCLESITGFVSSLGVVSGVNDDKQDEFKKKVYFLKENFLQIY